MRPPIGPEQNVGRRLLRLLSHQTRMLFAECVRTPSARLSGSEGASRSMDPRWGSRDRGSGLLSAPVPPLCRSQGRGRIVRECDLCGIVQRSDQLCHGFRCRRAWPTPDSAKKKSAAETDAGRAVRLIGCPIGLSGEGPNVAICLTANCGPPFCRSWTIGGPSGAVANDGRARWALRPKSELGPDRDWPKRDVAAKSVDNLSAFCFTGGESRRASQHRRRCVVGAFSTWIDGMHAAQTKTGLSASLGRRGWLRRPSSAAAAGTERAQTTRGQCGLRRRGTARSFGGKSTLSADETERALCATVVPGACREGIPSVIGCIWRPCVIHKKPRA